MTAAARASVSLAPHTMRCMEVWGGNQPVDNGVVMAGLDAWLYSRPCAGASSGGDIHFVSSCAAGMVTRVLIADVCGHGEAVSEAALSLRSLMRRYVNYIDQTLFVRGLNAEFAGLVQSGGFATAVVATYLAHEGRLEVCNAGHPRPLWYRARSRTWSLLIDERAGEGGDGPVNTPLGVVEPACYNKLSTRLATGDLIILYTDSLIEARDPEGRQLGERGLLELAQRLAPIPPEDPHELLHALLGAVSAHSAGDGDGGDGGGSAGAPDFAASDDVTVLILRPNGLRPRLSIVAHLKATARMAGEVVGSLQDREREFPSPEGGLFARLGAVLNKRGERGRAELP